MALRRKKRRARARQAWLEPHEVAADVVWRKRCAPMLRVFRRTPKRGWTTRELILWALEKKTEADPREMVAWLELFGEVRYAGERWWLRNAAPSWSVADVRQALRGLIDVTWDHPLSHLEEATQQLVDVVDEADNPPPFVLTIEREVVAAHRARDVDELHKAARRGLERLDSEGRRS